MKPSRFWPWLVTLLGASYFIMPLIATLRVLAAHAARLLQL
jgi:hypothetical protein